MQSGTFTALNVSYKNAYLNITARRIQRKHYHYNCPKCDADCLVLGIPFKDQTQMTLLKDAGIYTFRAKTTVDYEREQKERIENDKGMEFLRRFLRKESTNQRTEEPPAKKYKSMYGNDRVKFLLAVQYRYKVIFQATRIHFISNSTTIKTLYNKNNNNVLLSLHQRNSVDSGLFTGLCHNHRLDNFFLGTSNCSVQLFDKSKTTVPGQPFSSRSYNSQPARHVGDARRGTSQRW